MFCLSAMEVSETWERKVGFLSSVSFLIERIVVGFLFFFREDWKSYVVGLFGCVFFWELDVL
jgi:hypothetical protein